MQLTWLIGKQLIDASMRTNDWALRFEGDSILVVECLWRIVDTERVLVTSLEQGQKSTICVNHGGTDEIEHVFRDVAKEMSEYLQFARIRSAIVKPITNDMHIHFDNGLSLLLILDRSNRCGWCLQSPELNLVANAGTLAVHTKQSEHPHDEQTDGRGVRTKTLTMSLEVGQFVFLDGSGVGTVIRLPNGCEIPDDHAGVWFGTLDNDGRPIVCTIPIEYLRDGPSSTFQH